MFHGAGPRETRVLRAAMAEGVANGWRSGLFFGFPLEDVHVSVTHLVADSGMSPTVLKAALADAVKQAALSAKPAVLEPVMKVRCLFLLHLVMCSLGDGVLSTHQLSSNL